MKVKELFKTVNVAWSPATQYPIFLAAGTAAQQLDASFSTLSTLDLYELNLLEPGYEMALKASVPSDHRFHKIIWGGHNLHQTNPSGVIVGGCDKGTIKIYSASKLLANDTSNCLISTQDKHTGAVRAMDFNPFMSNLLATGSAESQIFIWDIEKTDMTPMKPGVCSQPPEDVQHIAWNKQVQHILASTFSQRCVIWDLRKNEAIIKLTDANAKVRWKVVDWHPDVATQLCLASEDDQAPVIELWDLRFATSPLKTLQNHQRGVLSIAWCPHDSNLLLSCSKDNRILCWDPNSDVPNGEVICELAQTTQWNFDVSWCPRHPGLIVGSSFDGQAVVYSLLGGRQHEAMEIPNKIVDSFPGMDPFTQPPHPIHTETTAELTKAPKWLKRPFGSKFGFGGKLTIFENEPVDPNNPSVTSKKVFISSVITNPELIQRSNELGNVLKTQEYSDYCKKKIEAFDDEHKKNVWKCIGSYFEQDEKTELFSILGYNVDSINNKLNQFVPPEISDIAEGVSKLGNTYNGNAFDGSAAFDAIAQQEQIRSSPVQKKIEKDLEINTTDDEEGLITQALLVKNIEAAVSLCFENKRYADAIILSMAGSSDLLARTQYRYFSEHSGALNSLISSVVSENWSEIVNKCNIHNWASTLVGIFMNCNNEERAALCDVLGDRLLSSDHPALREKAQICYICSGNLSKFVDASNSDIEEVVELITILQKALEYKGNKQVKLEGKVASVMVTYAEMLASEGSFEAALSFLGNSEEPKIKQFRDRLHRSLGHTQAETTYSGNTRSNVGGYFDPMRRVSQTNTLYNPMQQQQQQAPPTMNQQWNTDPTRQSMNSYLTPQTPYNIPSVPSIPSQPPIPNQLPNQSNNSYNQMSSMPSYMSNQPTALPPPPPSSTSTSSRPPSVGPTSRPRHVIDPSIKSAPSYINTSPFSQTSNMYSNPGYPSQNSYPSQPANLYPSNPINSTFFNPNEADTAQSTALSGGSMMSQNYSPIRNQPMPRYPEDPNIYRDQQSGWNDPPNIKSSRIPQEKPEVIPQPPITHPLELSGPSLDPTMPCQDMYYPDSQMYNQQQYNQIPCQQYNRPMDMMQNMPVQSAQVVQAPEPEKPKPPIPVEHMHLKTVLDELRVQCLEHAKNPQTKRKIEEVSKKLEVLYDCLRENKLSQNTLEGLHQISQLIQKGDYTSGLSVHTQLVSGSDFSQIASFMPGVKVLLQSALQLGVYIR